MSVRIWDSSCFIAEDDTLQTSSSDYKTLICAGDTFRIATQRNPASNGTGQLGEFCMGTVSGATYLYYYNGSQWLRCQFSTY